MHLPSFFKGIEEVEKQLDPTNIMILRAMWKLGPRNLLKISRRIGAASTSVHERVARLEAKSGRIAFLIPKTREFGLSRVMVLVESRPGSEEVVTAALKIPNLWRSINRCEGVFTHQSIHAVPNEFLNDFKKYVKQFLKLGLVRRYRVFQTTDIIPNFPNFNCYDPKEGDWKFQWPQWMNALKHEAPKQVASDSIRHAVRLDKKDLLIIKELQKNARIPLADMAPQLGMSLPGVKYRFDKMARAGLLQPIAFDVYPYPVEVSAYHEVMLEFTTNHTMSSFLSLTPRLFFIIGAAKVLNSKTLIVRTYILESQLRNMFAFFSQMAREGMIESYSSVRLEFAGRETQTISYELFDDEKGWVINMRQCVTKLSELASANNLRPAPRSVRRISKATA